MWRYVHWFTRNTGIGQTDCDTFSLNWSDTDKGRYLSNFPTLCVFNTLNFFCNGDRNSMKLEWCPYEVVEKVWRYAGYAGKSWPINECCCCCYYYCFFVIISSSSSSPFSSSASSFSSILLLFFFFFFLMVWFGIGVRGLKEAWQPNLRRVNEEPLLVKTRMEDSREAWRSKSVENGR